MVVGEDCVSVLEIRRWLLEVLQTLEHIMQGDLSAAISIIIRFFLSSQFHIVDKIEPYILRFFESIRIERPEILSLGVILSSVC